ncbi:hypothetical protein EPN42_06210 [bacterium]|nr:MAG: hypothetical protein EPN42_06210 [bacterium]
MGKLVELNARGDTTTTWEPTDEASLRETDAKFEALMARGFSMVERTTDEDTFHRTEHFDPRAEEIVAIFPMTGG